MKVVRVVLLIANGVWLPDFAYQSASHVYCLATYPATHDLIFPSLRAVTIPAVVGSLTLVGNIIIGPTSTSPFCRTPLPSLS